MLAPISTIWLSSVKSGSRPRVDSNIADWWMPTFSVPPLRASGRRKRKTSAWRLAASRESCSTLRLSPSPIRSTVWASVRT